MDPGGRRPPPLWMVIRRLGMQGGNPTAVIATVVIELPLWQLNCHHVTPLLAHPSKGLLRYACITDTLKHRLESDFL